MKNVMLSLVAMFFLCSCAGMQSGDSTSDSDITGAKLIDYGIVDVNVEKTDDNVETTAAGIYHFGKITGVKERTNYIPLKRYESFGIVYEVTGSNRGLPVEITVKMMHPPIKGRTISSDNIVVNIGEARYLFYTFEENYEFAEGDYIMQIWDKERLLLEKAFVVKI